ncbi:succinic semialdehyde dehydrogenase [Streptomyces sp. NPDC046215]|uniref:Succinic semialdehyde dehydrogenase n=1 Tax=Streptomyces stramineus TaxID=173861 RepID=A0ABN1A4H7_9ACTN
MPGARPPDSPGPLGRANIEGRPARYTTTLAPFTGRPLGRVPHCGPDDVARAFDQARTAQPAWAQRSVRDRAKVFLRLHDLVLRHREEAMDLIQQETGKARRDAFEEVLDVALTARHYGRHAPALLKPRRRRGALPLFTRTVEYRRPLGVVGLIIPWNYPLTFAVCDAVPALLAGNAVVCRPDLLGAFTAVWARDLLQRAGLPSGVFRLVTGPGDQVGPMVVGRSDHVCFTGSPATGRTVAALAGSHLIGCTLELGGKNSFVVLDDARLTEAVEGAVRACFTSAGQLCMSAERVLVHHSLYEAFLQAFTVRTRALRLGTTFDHHYDVGSLVSRARLRAVDGHVRDAVAKGAHVHAGGRHRPDVGPYFYEPTVLTGVSADMALHTDEVFGPVTAVYPFRDDEDAVQQANAGRFGLNVSIWTRDTARAHSLGLRIRAGTVNINEPYAAAYSSVDAPMGGMGDSGIGRRHGRDGILAYTEAQTIATQRLVALRAPAFMPQATYEQAVSRVLLTVRRLGAG